MRHQNTVISLKFSLILLFLFLLECDDQEKSESGASSNPSSLLKVEDVFPKNVSPLGSVRLEGIGFGIEGENDGVWLSGIRMPIRYWTATQIDFVLPKETPRGAYLGVVRANDRVSEPFDLNVLSSDELSIGQQIPDQSSLESQDIDLQDMDLQTNDGLDIQIVDAQIVDAQSVDM